MLSCFGTMLPADVVKSFICFAAASVTELPPTVIAIQAVCRSWNVSVFKTAAKLLFTLPYVLRLVTRRINFVPLPTSVNRIMVNAQHEMGRIIREPELFQYTLIVNAQLILQRLLAQNRPAYDFTFGEMVDVFVNSVAGVLDCEHPFVREGILETLDILGSYENFLEINIWCDILSMERCWRNLQKSHFCLAAMIDVLYKLYLCRSLGISPY